MVSIDRAGLMVSAALPSSECDVALRDPMSLRQPPRGASGLTTVLPLTRAEATLIITSDKEETFHAAFRAVSPDYFRAMGIPVVLGRIFTDTDTADSPRVAIANEALARKMWPGENPLGRTLKWGKGVPIVGVVRSIKHKGLDAEPEPELYLPYLQHLGVPQSALVVRTDSNSMNMVAAISKAIREFEPNQPIVDVRSMEHVVYDSRAQPRFYTLLLGIYSVLAVILASTGIYGVMSYFVSQQQHEIGIRMALGDQSRDIVVQFVRRWLRYVVVGIAIGLGAALGMTRLLSTMLYEVKQTDPATYISLFLFLRVWTTVATLIPARCITRVDPMVALRYQKNIRTGERLHRSDLPPIVRYSCNRRAP
jgi:predicted permease